ncbi:MAG: hypothetical protein WCB69_00795, partial [Pseudolabrys sp.]
MLAVHFDEARDDAQPWLPHHEGRATTLIGEPTARGFTLVVAGCLEHRRRQRRLDMKKGGAGVGEAVLTVGRHDHQLTAQTVACSSPILIS